MKSQIIKIFQLTDEASKLVHSQVGVNEDKELSNAIIAISSRKNEGYLTKKSITGFSQEKIDFAILLLEGEGLIEVKSIWEKNDSVFFPFFRDNSGNAVYCSDLI